MFQMQQKITAVKTLVEEILQFHFVELISSPEVKTVASIKPATENEEDFLDRGSIAHLLHQRHRIQVVQILYNWIVQVECYIDGRELANQV